VRKRDRHRAGQTRQKREDRGREGDTVITGGEEIKGGGLGLKGCAWDPVMYVAGAYNVT
jgi:hypothetical protein